MLARMSSELLRRNLDPILVGAVLQLVPVGGRDVPVDDGSVGLGDLAVRDTRRLHGIIDIDAANQQQRTQDHSDKRLHDNPSVAPDNAVSGGWFRGREHDPEKWKPVFRKDHAQTSKRDRDAILSNRITIYTPFSHCRISAFISRG